MINAKLIYCKTAKPKFLFTGGFVGLLKFISLPER
nr:MAG TPA: hypothetical protein [Caudoviricetes sp.]